MATAGKNLSDYDKLSIPSASKMYIGIVVSEWNNFITEGLLKGALEALAENDCPSDNIIVEHIPGTFELPLAAQTMLEYKPKLDGVICIGSVIQGETKHFDFVCDGATQGIKDVSLKYNKPVGFCVLTDNNKQQGIDRSGGKHGNKGVEAAVTVIKMIALQKKYATGNSEKIGF